MNPIQIMIAELERKFSLAQIAKMLPVTLRTLYRWKNGEVIPQRENDKAALSELHAKVIGVEN